MQSETIMRYHNLPIRIPKIKRTDEIMIESKSAVGGQEAMGGKNSNGRETTLEVRDVSCFDYTDILTGIYVCPNSSDCSL